VDLDEQHRNPEGGLRDADDNEQLYPLRIRDGGGRADPTAERDGSWGGTCGTQPRWKERRRAFTYGDDNLTHDGLHSLLLRSGKEAGKGKIVVEGKGSNLKMPTLPPRTPITVQLKRGGGTSCWEATYSKARVSRADLFKATSD